MNNIIKIDGFVDNYEALRNEFKWSANDSSNLSGSVFIIGKLV